ncbi:MAG TPA: type I glutamate--ammonia ligase, partial [Pseudomonadales bacterium]|nr:type I glutamate--ammonia ligase [Pseudomonadales bacterium]HJP49689.1 type I glutamate--ammonia ligase [Pseudomonadales bacterium]
MSERTLQLIKDNNAKWVDLRFTDPRGKEQHVTNNAAIINSEFFENGAMFDGSSIAGWKAINESDMILMPDDDTAIVDPFTEETTINLRCDIVEPTTLQGYERDPRSTAKRAETYLASTGIGDTAFFGPEAEFFVFDDVKYKSTMSGAMYEIESEEAAWMTDATFDGGNLGHRPGIKGGYFPVPPVDSMLDIRNSMCAAMEAMGVTIELHHHEVGTAGQAEIGARFNSLTTKADELQIYKYCVLNVAYAYGKTATFMPKPLVGDNGNGMHCHQSIFKGDTNVFAGDGYGNLSQEALWYIGGIIKHARALNAFSNASTNSYKRLVPGFEAPLLLVYSARNRSASIRIPYVQGGSPKGVRVEVRFGDPTANPYLMFASMLMAGLDGIKNKIDPGGPLDKDLYDLPPEELTDVPTVCSSLEMALENLDA